LFYFQIFTKKEVILDTTLPLGNGLFFSSGISLSFNFKPKGILWQIGTGKSVFIDEEDLPKIKDFLFKDNTERIERNEKLKLTHCTLKYQTDTVSPTIKITDEIDDLSFEVGIENIDKIIICNIPIEEIGKEAKNDLNTLLFDVKDLIGNTFLDDGMVMKLYLEKFENSSIMRELIFKDPTFLTNYLNTPVSMDNVDEYFQKGNYSNREDFGDIDPFADSDSDCEIIISSSEEM
jgi:hypothetical protein